MSLNLKLDLESTSIRFALCQKSGKTETVELVDKKNYCKVTSGDIVMESEYSSECIELYKKLTRIACKK